MGDTLTLTDRVGGGVGIAMRRGDEALRSSVNEALASIKQDGSYAKMPSPYFDFDITPPRECQ